VLILYFFEPSASWSERSGFDTIVAPVDAAVGPSVYTVVIFSIRTVRERPQSLQKAMDALHRGATWLKDAEVARATKPFLFRGALEDIERGVAVSYQLNFETGTYMYPKRHLTRFRTYWSNPAR
jgi:hypothetical protein